MLVGFTGVGGGSLMAPVMILLLGVAPVTAVGTDLWFASITKTVGATVHHVKGGADLKVVKRLCMGSIPLALLTVLILSLLDIDQVKQGIVTQSLGAVLMLTALATFYRRQLHEYGRQLRLKSRTRFKRLQVPLTVAAGALLGVLVTMTSVGAGALGATILLFLYPLRLTVRKVVGTDIAHAVPLTLIAGLGHVWLGNVSWRLLFGLLSGSIPGIVLGSLVAHKLRESLIQIALATVLFIVGLRLILT